MKKDNNNMTKYINTFLTTDGHLTGTYGAGVWRVRVKVETITIALTNNGDAIRVAAWAQCSHQGEPLTLCIAEVRATRSEQDVEARAYRIWQRLQSVLGAPNDTLEVRGAMHGNIVAASWERPGAEYGIIADIFKTA